MSSLCDLKCDVCKKGAPLLSDSEIVELRREIPLWETISESDVNQIYRQFNFRNFKDALEFTNSVGSLAEENGHHPAILTEWGSVTVTYWTHKIKGLHKSDFIMAAKTDKLYGGIS